MNLSRLTSARSLARVLPRLTVGQDKFGNKYYEQLDWTVEVPGEGNRGSPLDAFSSSDIDSDR